MKLSADLPAMLECASLAWIGGPTARPILPARSLAAFEDSDDFLLAPEPYGFDFYVVQMQQQGVRGLDLIRLIRRRSPAGLLALGQHGLEELAAALNAGADMLLPGDASAEQLRAAVLAIRRRSSATHPAAEGPRSPSGAWTLFADQAVLRAPDGTAIPLSDSDLSIMRCFARTGGGCVERQRLVECLWGKEAATGAMDNALHATLYRLRKRIEQAGQQLVPVRAIAKVGYEFRAPLQLVPAQDA